MTQGTLVEANIYLLGFVYLVMAGWMSLFMSVGVGVA